MEAQVRGESHAKKKEGTVDAQQSRGKDQKRTPAAAERVGKAALAAERVQRLQECGERRLEFVRSSAGLRRVRARRRARVGAEGGVQACLYASG